MLRNCESEQNLDVVADMRWSGNFGIGRFSKEVNQRVSMSPLSVGGKPWDAFEPLLLSGALWRLDRRFRVFYSPGFNSPLYSRIPFVFTIHDLNHIDVSANTNWLKRSYYKVVLKRACRRAASVLTVSEFSRKRIIDWSGVEASKVVNVSEGVEPIYCPIGDVHTPGFTYFFSVSNRKLHKNEAGIVRAFAKARVPRAMRLVFTGPATAKLGEVITQEGLEDRVVFAGTLSDMELAQYYRGAVALVFPSFYEGFGLPVLEAMACGTPVITSNTTALLEVAGNAALLVNPESVSDITAAMEAIENDRSLAEGFRARGLERVREFSWERTADQVRAVLTAVSR